MSTETRFRGPDPDRPPSLLRRVRNFAAHHAVWVHAWLMGAAIGAFLYLDVPLYRHPTARWWRGHTRIPKNLPTVPLADVVSIGGVAMLILATLVSLRMSRHPETACDYCAVEYELVDGPARAEKQVRWLRLHHLISRPDAPRAPIPVAVCDADRRMLVRAVIVPLVLAVLLAVSALLLLVLAVVAFFYLVPRPYDSLIGLIGFGVFMSVPPIVAERHRLLQQWCPWCRSPGDNDDDLIEPLPVPTVEIDLFVPEPVHVS